MPVYLKSLEQNSLPAVKQCCRKCGGKESVLVGRTGRQVARCSRCGFLMPRAAIQPFALDYPDLAALRS